MIIEKEVLLRCESCHTQTLFNHPDGWLKVFNNYFRNLEVEHRMLSEIKKAKDWIIKTYRGTYLCSRC